MFLISVFHFIPFTLSILGFVFFTEVNADTNPSLPYPYNSVEILPFDPHAHFGSNQIEGLSYLIKHNKIKTVAEIGSYLGASTCFIAELLPYDGKVYAVDHWLGNTEWSNHLGFREAQPFFYQQFLSNVIHKRLCEKIIPMKMPSIEAAQVIDAIPDLVFLDGSHDFDSVYEDLSAWYPLLEENGVLCGDDFNWGVDKPVKRAVLRFAEENNLRVNVINDWFWYYQLEER